EALADAAHSRRKVLGEEWTHRAEHAGGEKAERESENQHGSITERDHGVENRNRACADGEYQKCEAPSDSVGEITARYVAAKRTGDRYGQISGRVENRQM